MLRSIVLALLAVSCDALLLTPRVPAPLMGVINAAHDARVARLDAKEDELRKANAELEKRSTEADAQLVATQQVEDVGDLGLVQAPLAQG